jgi:hypothetical protein
LISNAILMTASSHALYGQEQQRKRGTGVLPTLKFTPDIC